MYIPKKRYLELLHRSQSKPKLYGLLYVEYSSNLQYGPRKYNFNLILVPHYCIFWTKLTMHTKHICANFRRWVPVCHPHNFVSWKRNFLLFTFFNKFFLFTLTMIKFSSFFKWKLKSQCLQQLKCVNSKGSKKSRMVCIIYFNMP